jgi:hypothetical protein
VIGLRLTGVIVAMAGGGLVSDWRGWRVAFYLGGLPGLILGMAGIGAYGQFA